MDNLIEIIEWNLSTKKDNPKTKCCYTCIYYTDGICIKFKESPPDDFKIKDNLCLEFIENTPF